MIEINELHFDKDGLIPAIITDVDSGAILMLAYMNKESLRISIDEGRTCFWSRSRGELWRKGETTGNIQHILNIKTDCDLDTLLVTVRKDGPACHTGAESCFFADVFGEETGPFTLSKLYSIIEGRKISRKPGSYTTYLFEKGVDKILKKIGEESAEVIIAGKGGDKAEAIFEIADLAYHTLVLMAEMGITLDDVKKELASRHVADKK